MRNLTPREQRTIRYGGIGLGIYLILFFGFHVWRMIDQKRADYKDMVAQARSLKSEIEAYQTRVLVAEKLMKEYHLDPAKLSEASVVAGASAAIQTEAGADGIGLGTIRESPAQVGGLELASIHIEGSGQIPSMLKLLDRLQRLGYPLIIDSVQMTSDSMQPGRIKFDMTITVLDFDQWKNKEASHA
ncbi:MAG TPA: hypothetical protein VMF08_18790 [Candidatus Sulfotelmatobacter sp.]|nr:hypothetical protein [Candidatus Sulfotelmatobacter sp.]